MTKLACYSCALFSLFVCTCVCLSCLTDDFIDSLCVLIPVFLRAWWSSSPFQDPLLSPFFLFLPFSHSQSCRGSFTATSTLTSTPTPTFMLFSLSIPCMALCYSHNGRGQAMRSLSTGELQAWLNLDHPHRHPVHRGLTAVSPPPAQYFCSAQTNSLTCPCKPQDTHTNIIFQKFILARLLACRLVQIATIIRPHQWIHTRMH